MHASADLTSQANHLGVTIEADIIKQKLPDRNGGYKAVEAELGKPYGKTSKLVYEKLTTDNPIDLVRYQVGNCYLGRCAYISPLAPRTSTRDRYPSTESDRRP